jgi:PLP dependent protein
MSTITSLEDRIRTVRAQVAEAALDAGRDPADVTLIAVSKTFLRDDVDAAWALGIRHFGENRVQEAQHKFQVPLPDNTTLHLIGRLQSNKARFVPALFDIVDSVDRGSIVTALDRAAATTGAPLDVLLQVNVAGEQQKGGCRPDEAAGLMQKIDASGWLVPRGLMTIAPIDAEGEGLHGVFRRLRELRDELQTQFPELDLRQLSMGMSDDYREAIAEGATQVRIGRAIFGDR